MKSFDIHVYMDRDGNVRASITMPDGTRKKSIEPMSPEKLGSLLGDVIGTTCEDSSKVDDAIDAIFGDHYEPEASP